MSLDIKKSIELQRFVLGEKPEVRNCRFDNISSSSNGNLEVRSASTMTSEVVVYPGSSIKKILTPKQMIELQERILQS